jgi:hypothetical protein
MRLRLAMLTEPQCSCRPARVSAAAWISRARIGRSARASTSGCCSRSSNSWFSVVVWIADMCSACAVPEPAVRRPPAASASSAGTAPNLPKIAVNLLTGGSRQSWSEGRASDRQAGGHWFESSTAHSPDVTVTTEVPANRHIPVYRSLRERNWASNPPGTPAVRREYARACHRSDAWPYRRKIHGARQSPAHSGKIRIIQTAERGHFRPPRPAQRKPPLGASAIARRVSWLDRRNLPLGKLPLGRKRFVSTRLRHRTSTRSQRPNGT